MYNVPAHCLVFLYFWTFLVTSRMPTILPPGGQGSSSGIRTPSFQNPATSIELIQHQLGNTGPTVQSVGKAWVSSSVEHKSSLSLGSVCSACWLVRAEWWGFFVSRIWYKYATLKACSGSKCKRTFSAEWLLDNPLLVPSPSPHKTKQKHLKNLYSCFLFIPGHVQSTGFQLSGPASMGIPPPSISQQMQPSGPASMGIPPPSFRQQMQPSGPVFMGIPPPSFRQQMQPSGPASTGISPPSFSQQMQPSGPASVPVGESSNSTLQITSESFAALNKNPISALMEYAQSRRMQAIIEVVNQKGPSHRPV